MKHWNIDIQELKRLWEAGWLASDLAARYGCTQSMIYWLRKKHNIASRDRQAASEPPPPSDEDAVASEDSLALSPWVAKRAEMFRREKELRGEPERVELGVTAVMTYSRRGRTVY